MLGRCSQVCSKAPAPLHQKFQCDVSFPSSFEQLVNLLGFSIESFSGQIRGSRSLVLCRRFVNRWRSGRNAVNRDAFNQGATLNDRGARGQVEHLVQAFCHVRGLGRLVALRFRYCIGRIQEDPRTNFRSIVSFAKTLIEVGLEASMGLVEGLVGFLNRGLKLVSESNAVFSCRGRCVVVVMKSELWRRSGQGNV